MSELVLSFNVNGIVQGAARASSSVNSVSAAVDNLNKRLTDGVANAAKQVLGLVAAYKSLEAVSGFVKRGIEFNSSIEKSTIGMSSLITAMVELEDEQGRVLEGAEKYAAAQGIAAKMMQRIQILGLETTATTLELVEGVQSVMGAAVNAGIQLENIPDLAINAAQAMQTMGIPLQQMRTEIEALITGNINKSQDLLAPRLQIDKEIIDSWREQGVLTENLMEKLQAFKLAGADVAQTWAGLTSNLEEALDVVAGDASKQMLEPLKETVRNLQDFFVTTKDGFPAVGKDIEHVAGLVERLEAAFGEQLLSAVNGFIGVVKDANAAIGDMGGAEAAYGELKSSVAAVTAALVTMTAVRKTGVAESIRATAQQAASEWKLQEAARANELSILNSAEARRQQAAASVETARANNTAAQASLANAQAQLENANAARRNAVSAMDVVNAEQRQLQARTALTAAQVRADAASRNLVTAEQNLAAATAAAGAAATRSGSVAAAAGVVWTRVTTAVTAGVAKLAAGLKALWAGLGGGVGLAITGLVTGISYLSTRQDDAAKATELHTKAQKEFKAATENATNSTGDLTRALTAAEKIRVELSRKKAQLALTIQINEASAAIERATREMRAALKLGFNLDEFVPQAMLDRFDELTAKFKTGKISLTSSPA